MLAFSLLSKECGATLCDVERTAQIVGDNTRKLSEPLVLLTQLSLTFDTLSHVPSDPNETSYLTIGDYRRKFRLPEACYFADPEFLLIRDRFAGLDTAVIVHR